MSAVREPSNQSAADREQFAAIEGLFSGDDRPLIDRIDAFPKYATRQSLAKFITKVDLFRKIIEVNGSIVECGVLDGAGLLAWAKLSSIFEPVNHTRKIIGFDTFSGFAGVTDPDRHGTFHQLKEGGLRGLPLERVQEAAKVYDLNRPLVHIPKVELVAGDIAKTAAEYLSANPHLVVAMLYLDLDLYEPTWAAIGHFVSRMPKGAVIVFDQLNAKLFPGETTAVDRRLGIKNIEIRRFPYDPYVSYTVL